MDRVFWKTRGFINQEYVNLWNKGVVQSDNLTSTTKAALHLDVWDITLQRRLLTSTWSIRNKGPMSWQRTENGKDE